MLTRIICLLIGYCCGLFQTAYIIGKLHNIDIRQHGSGNAGTTNALRILGKKAGVLTLLGDCLKTVVAMSLVRLLFSSSQGNILPLLTVYAAFGTILGHNFPFYLKFRGGKGVAASLGFLIGFDWKAFLICITVFIALVAWKRYVSLGSIAAYLTGWLVISCFGLLGWYHMPRTAVYEMIVVILLMTILAVFRHRANIKRLLNGSENKFSVKK